MKAYMQVAVMNGKQDISIEQRPIPEPAPGEVLIRIQAAGVCGSDLHYYSEGKIGDLPVQTPFVLGHEIAGTIVQLGEGVRNFSLGDLVAVEPGIPCGKCELCKAGHYNLCPEMKFLATPPYDGAFSEYLAYPAEWVYRLPGGMNAVQGALIEPLAVGMHAAQLAEAGVGQSAFIFGCGCIGLVTLLALRSHGVSEIYMCDVIDKRLEKALELGATAVFNSRSISPEEEVMRHTGGRGVDCVFEMTGNAAALMQTTDVVCRGGVIVLVGLGTQSIMPFNFDKLIWNQVQIRPCFRYKNIYPKAIRAISGGMIDVESIVSDEVELAQLPRALKYHLENKSEITKMIVKMGGA